MACRVTTGIESARHCTSRHVQVSQVPSCGGVVLTSDVTDEHKGPHGCMRMRLSHTHLHRPGGHAEAGPRVMRHTGARVCSRYAEKEMWMRALKRTLVDGQSPVALMGAGVDTGRLAVETGTHSCHCKEVKKREFQPAG